MLFGYHVKPKRMREASHQIESYLHILLLSDGIIYTPATIVTSPI